MRVDEIKRLKMVQSDSIPEINSVDISGQLSHQFRLLPRELLRRRIMRRIAGPMLAATAHLTRKRHEVSSRTFADAMGIGDRFVNDAALHFLLAKLHKEAPPRVLVPGCYLAGEDVQFWLRRGVAKLVGIDLNSLAATWEEALPKLEKEYNTKVEFLLSPLEATPFEQSSFDVIATTAVLEHVSNLPAMIKESARILRPRGWAFHSFGPLYFAFGADHCISQFGFEHGYDHLLLSDEAYQEKIWDQAFFDRTSDPNFPFWARRSQFSYATADEYLHLFRAHFDVEFVSVALSAEGLRFRDEYPLQWARLKSSGIAERDLLIKGMSVVLRNR